LEARLGELSTRLEEVSGALEERAEADSVESLQQTVAELTGRLESLARVEDVESVRASVEQTLASQPGVDPELGQRPDQVASRLDELHGRVEEVAGSVPDPQADPAADLRALVQELADRPTAEPELAITVDALAARLEELTATVGALKEASSS